ncbi:hypothetical protein, partial [Comamonas thiooxydans]|uniref:hypothetical protein n=1 Tax=Comamonas thiooxydans TaxID=363952 RepID=UPI001C0E8F8F
SPRAFNAALYAFQFVVRYLTRPQLVSLISRAYLTCDRHLCNNASAERQTQITKNDNTMIFSWAVIDFPH